MWLAFHPNSTRHVVFFDAPSHFKSVRRPGLVPRAGRERLRSFDKDLKRSSHGMASAAFSSSCGHLGSCRRAGASCLGKLRGALGRAPGAERRALGALNRADECEVLHAGAVDRSKFRTCEQGSFCRRPGVLSAVDLTGRYKKWISRPDREQALWTILPQTRPERARGPEMDRSSLPEGGFSFQVKHVNEAPLEDEWLSIASGGDRSPAAEAQHLRLRWAAVSKMACRQAW